MGKIVGRTLLGALAALLVWTAAPTLQAADHVVAPAQAAARLDEQAATRAERIASVQQFLDEPEARAQAEALGADVARLKTKVALLSDQELRDLEQRTKAAQDPTAGRRHHIRERHGLNPTYVLVALVVVLTLLLLAIAD